MPTTAMVASEKMPAVPMISVQITLMAEKMQKMAAMLIA
jgi:hypothetical protein